jgi:hypothetical protein
MLVMDQIDVQDLHVSCFLRVGQRFDLGYGLHYKLIGLMVMYLERDIIYICMGCMARLNIILNVLKLPKLYLV